MMTSLLTEDCSRFLPPQHRTLDHRLFEDIDRSYSVCLGNRPILRHNQRIRSRSVGRSYYLLALQRQPA